MKSDQKERRHLSHHALVESAIRMTKQLAASNDVMTRALANRMFSDLSLLRRGLPNRRLYEHGNVKGAAVEEAVAPIVRTAVVVAPQVSEPAIELSAQEREISQTRERCAAQPTVLCLQHAAAETFQLFAITPLHEKLGSLDLAVDANNVNHSRSISVAAKIASPQTRVIYFAKLLSELGIFARQSQNLGTFVHWVMQPEDDHPLAADAAFWESVAGADALGELEQDGANRLQLRTQRKEIPHAGEVKCWATCLLALPTNGDTEQPSIKLLTNLSLPDLAHAGELLEWYAAVKNTDCSPKDENGMPAEVSASSRLDQLAWGLAHESTALAIDCFSEEEILAVHLLAKQTVEQEQISLTQLAHLMANLGNVVNPDAPLAAGLLRMEDAVIGLLASTVTHK